MNRIQRNFALNGAQNLRAFIFEKFAKNLDKKIKLGYIIQCLIAWAIFFFALLAPTAKNVATKFGKF